MQRKPQKKVVGIGELLWDMLPQGKQFGGAPCNFAFHAHQSGFDSYVISAVGEDVDGNEIFKVMDNLGLNSDLVQSTTEFPTGTVTVKLDRDGVPEYTIHENVAWDHIEWNEYLNALAQEADAVCFGSLAQRNRVSKETIRRFLEATKSDCLRVFDINLRQSFFNREGILESLELASVLKLNEDELPVVAEYLGYSGGEEDLLSLILDRFQLQLIAYTKGIMGSLLISPDEKSYCEVPSVKVADTVGAGDSFTAVLLAGMLHGFTLNNTHNLATEVAAFVCTQHGATPQLPGNLIEKLKS